MTLDDLEKIEREFLVPNDVAQILGCDPYNINVQARKDQLNGTKSFPFPVIMIFLPGRGIFSSMMALPEIPRDA